MSQRHENKRPLATVKTVPMTDSPPDAKPVAQIVIIWEAVDNGDGTKRLLDPKIETTGVESLLPQVIYTLSSMSVHYMDLIQILDHARVQQRRDDEQAARIAMGSGTAPLVESATAAELRQMEIIGSMSN